jgi:hypothetical protein
MHFVLLAGLALHQVVLGSVCKSLAASAAGEVPVV